jgi:hypothetical protein
LCRHKLQKFHRKFLKNLNYLEKYLGQEAATEKRDKDIVDTKKNIAEIEQRLSVMKSNQPEKYAICDIKCSECGQKLCLHKNYQNGQECPPKNCRHKHKDKSEDNNKNFLDENQKATIKDYFLTHNIQSIKLENDS